MAVRHNVTDSDKYFIIDPITRTIKNQSGKLTLSQYDHNSERFTFECPRYVDGHDMSLCNKIEIHYSNTGAGNAKSTGMYIPDDLQVSADKEDAVTFSWLISRNVTQHVGKLNFVIRFACIGEESVVEYAWSTGIHSDITIIKSIYNGEAFIEEYIDILEMWKQDLYQEGLKISSIEQTTRSTEDEGINIITITMTDGSQMTFQIQNGSPGSSIKSIERTSGNGAPGTTDTYTITLTDGSTTTFQVYNGANGSSGSGSGDMASATYDPQGKRTDIFKYVDDAVEDLDSGDMVSTTYDPQGKRTDIFKYVDDAISDLDIGDTVKSENFYAIYDVTTNAEIEAAYAAGKKLYCIKGDAICPLYEYYASTIQCFYRGGFYIYCTNNTWMEECPYQGTNNLVTSITAESTDTQYPSAKAVYDLIAGAIDEAIGASY